MLRLLRHQRVVLSLLGLLRRKLLQLRAEVAAQLAGREGGQARDAHGRRAHQLRSARGGRGQGMAFSTPRSTAGHSRAKRRKVRATGGPCTTHACTRTHTHNRAG